MPSSRGSYGPRDGTLILYLLHWQAGFFFFFLPLVPIWKWSEVAQSFPALCDPMDCSLPGSSIHGIFQAKVLEWVAISFSRGIFLTQELNLGLLHCRQVLYHLSHQGHQAEDIKKRWQEYTVLYKKDERLNQCFSVLKYMYSYNFLQT